MQHNKEHNCIDMASLIKEAKINIEKYGLQVIMIEATDYLPSFAYSVGLWDKFNIQK